MPNIVVVGAQWGDEAKGKVVDYLAARAEVVVRYGGGSNAGHTVTTHGEVHKLHLVPSGILHENVTCVISAGVVVDPAVVVREISDLTARGCSVRNLRISGQAHVIMPYHRILDRLEEKGRAGAAIGTTGRGIGPAYADKASRRGLRLADLVDGARRHDALKVRLTAANEVLTGVYGQEPLDVESCVCEYDAYAEQLSGFVCDTAPLVAEAASREPGVVFEGAQGAMLDLDVGTYPFVTSSHPVAGGACLGTGVGPTSIDSVVGVAKAYTTRVGSGIFPTELTNETGDFIRERGHEYGTTTGRPRRCGWLDTVVLRYSAMHNGMRAVALGHLDVLSGLDALQVATQYRIGSLVTAQMPYDLGTRDDIAPVYEEMPGWPEDITDAKRYEDLPETCRAYVARVEELVGVPVWSVSVGPAREQMILTPGRSLVR
ncbi:MAG: adenylosuccinate synthase [Armatimonadetes bacterium]|nr:adenylosuccinate synthase [Armatimonadota bacterium]